MPASPSSAALKKSDVLSRINSVLDASGLNDCVWSVRDCDSTLFVLIFKKLFGKLPGIVTSPVSPAEHARNFDVVLRAVATDVLDMDLTHISPDALARGDLQALFNLAEIFSELCEILLERNDDENVVRPATTSSGSAKRPASARPTGTKESAVPEPPAEDADGDEDEAWEQPLQPAAVAEAAANTENHEGLSIRISPQRKGKPVRDEVARLEGVRVEGATGRPRSAGRVRSSAAGDEVAAEAHASARAAICAAVANCGDLPAKRPASAARGTAASRTRSAPSARRPAAAPPRDANAAARAAAAKRAAEYAKALERGVPGYRPATAPGKMSRKQTEQA